MPQNLNLFLDFICNKGVHIFNIEKKPNSHAQQR
jgi:hypothetical protein